MSVQSEARELLWGAVPPRLGDNRKSWIAYAAFILGWRPRRVRAIWNREARVITADEIRQLEARYEAQQQRAAQREKERHELRAFLVPASCEPLPVAERASDGAARSEPSPTRDLGEEQGRGDRHGDRLAGHLGEDE